jgi:hypothetical protein
VTKPWGKAEDQIKVKRIINFVILIITFLGLLNIKGSKII